ncbi:hypothetical protein EYF80_009987 [Liparis tanakae]|uniref:Uncharacterized protein n=1 Tax=Liparis tanakae TaxID=230148 RepID=A0A4Z2IQF3_9TELE|nr:hypothetical protein EYF80_009987 [Liparis tanakae]
MEKIIRPLITWIFPRTPVLSILLATFTVFPQMSYCGFWAPMTPAITGPMEVRLIAAITSEGRPTCRAPPNAPGRRAQMKAKLNLEAPRPRGPEATPLPSMLLAAWVKAAGASVVHVEDVVKVQETPKAAQMAALVRVRLRCFMMSWTGHQHSIVSPRTTQGCAIPQHEA